MRLNLKLRMGFAMLVALLLPLQGYAAMPVCTTGAAAAPMQAAAAPMHAAETPMHAGAATAAGHDCAGANTVHRHGCNQCCCGAAIVLAPVDFIAPHFGVPEIASAPIAPSPEGALDRLDRPPRFVLA